MRAINNVASRRRRKKVLKAARGAFSGRHRLFQNAKETMKRALAYAFRDRRAKKRTFRALWIVRLNNALRPLGYSYSRFIHAMNLQGVELDRKNLSNLAISHPQAFESVVKEIMSK